jgi:hypothetical protein
MDWASIIAMLLSFVSALSNAGPWGIGAMVLGALGVVGSLAYLIGGWNKSVDARDTERSGADAGQTAVDLKNQADANRKYEDAQRNEILKKGPPA